MQAQPPDSYQGPFPLRDPRFPQISQAHESAEEGWNRAEGIKGMQHHAMMQHGLRHAPLQQIHAERLGLEGGPDGGMHDHAPMTLAAASEYHTGSERQSTLPAASEYRTGSEGQSTAGEEEDEGAWWDHDGYDPRERAAPAFVHQSPFRNATQTGLVHHNGTQTEHYGSRQRREEGTDETEGGAGEGGGGGEGEERPSLRHYARAGWNHARPLAEFGGAALGATAVGGTYALGALGSLGYHGARGAANLVGNFLHHEEHEQEDVEMPEAPRTAPARGPPTQTEPREPVPPYLLDHEERMRAARRGPNLGAFASREYDRQRLEGYGRADARRRAYMGP